VVYMHDVVPGALQRLRESDVVSLAGLATASLGLEYCRCGHVTNTHRQGTSLTGVVTIPPLSPGQATARENAVAPRREAAPSQSFEIEIEVHSRSLCQAICGCGNETTRLCVHAAALLYQWINLPHTFQTLSTPPDDANLISYEIPGLPATHLTALRDSPSSLAISAPYASHTLTSRHAQINTIGETLTQF